MGAVGHVVSGGSGGPHTHATSEVTGLDTALADRATDSELSTGLAGKASTVHAHVETDVTGLTAALGGKAATVHAHAQGDVTGLVTALSGKAATSHTHAEADVTGLTAALGGKAATSHTHVISDTTGLQAALDELEGGGSVTLPAVAAGHYPAEAYGCCSMSVSPENADNAAHASGQIVFARMWVPAGKILTAAGFVIQTAATFVSNGSPSGLILYDDSGVKLAETANVTSGWNVTGWKFHNFVTPVAASGVDRFVYLGLLANGWSSLKICYRVGDGGALSGGRGVTNRRAFYSFGVSAIPASIDPATYGTANGYVPLLGLAS